MNIISLLFVFFGMIIFLWGCRNIFYGVISRGWPSTQGMMIGVDKQDMSIFNPQKFFNNDYFFSPGSKLKIKYSYKISDQNLQGNRFSFSTRFMPSGSPVKEMMEQYFRDKNITIFYNPQKINMCVLRRGISFLNFKTLSIGAAFIALGLASAIYFEPLFNDILSMIHPGR